MQSISNILFVLLLAVFGVPHIFTHPLTGSLTQNESDTSTVIESDTTAQSVFGISAQTESGTSTQTILGASTQTESGTSTQTVLGASTQTESGTSTESVLGVSTQSELGQRDLLDNFASSGETLPQVSDESEDMEVAETIIFRPLFSYRRDSASRGRF